MKMLNYTPEVRLKMGVKYKKLVRLKSIGFIHKMGKIKKPRLTTYNV